MPPSASASSPTSTDDDDETPKRPLTRVPAWIPISAFVGTSLALAIPLLILRSRQRAVLQMALNKDNKNHSPPPRRVVSSTSSSSSLLRRPTPLLPTSSPAVETIFSQDPDKASLNMMSAMSHINASSAMLAVKAFAIATGLVAIGGTALVWGVKEALGVKDAREFGNAMRLLLLGFVPSLSSAIYRPSPHPEEEEEAPHSFTPFINGVHQNWKWEDAEKRLKRAYEEGGISLWGQMALRELEAEARLEREKRDQEIKSRTTSE